MNYNRIILGGNLTREPELSYTKENLPICKTGIAVNRKWKETEEVLFVDLTIFGKGAEIFNQYLNKGGSVLVEGRLKLDQWTSADGTKRSKHGVIVDNFQFADSKPDGNGQAPATQPAPVAQPAPEHRQTTDDFPDDDIPF